MEIEYFFRENLTKMFHKTSEERFMLETGNSQKKYKIWLLKSIEIKLKFFGGSH